MNFNIIQQEKYSRGELLLRSFFGFIYILIPHGIVLMFLSIASMFISFIAFWSILFTGKYPEGMYSFQIKFRKWQLRVNARLLNLRDGYPSFGIDSIDEGVVFEQPYPENLSRGILLLRAFLGLFYVLIPHLFILTFRTFATQVIIVIAWFAVLFTGKYPKGMFDFVVGTIRWNLRLGLYMSNMTDTYPPFTGKILATENISASN
tara:strand:- start:1510 stop:2124 length:615 start_codon:yes stop_codon:yes gene_type:complete